MTPAWDYAVRIVDSRLMLVDAARPRLMLADFSVSCLPAPLTAVLARQCSAAPTMAGLLIDAARFFASHGKARRKAGRLPARIMGLLRDLEIEGHVR